MAFGFTLGRFSVAPQVGVVWERRGAETLTVLIGEAEGAYRLEDGLLELEEERDDIEFVRIENGERFGVAELFLHPIDINPLLGASARCAVDTLRLTITTAHDDDGPSSSVTLRRSR